MSKAAVARGRCSRRGIGCAVRACTSLQAIEPQAHGFAYQFQLKVESIN